MNPDKENISIVIPSHNNEATIERAVRSATIGARPADVIVVGDNDSSDGTYDILCGIIGAKPVTIDGSTGLPPKASGVINDTKVIIFKKRLSATGNTINTAIQTYWKDVTVFGFMDPASYYGPDKIKSSVEVMQRYPTVACVVSDCDRIHPDGRIERIFRPSFDAAKLMNSYCYDGNYLLRPQVFGIMKYGFNDQLWSMHDYDLLLRIADIGLIYHVPSSLHTIKPAVDNIEEHREMLLVQKLARGRKVKNEKG